MTEAAESDEVLMSRYARGDAAAFECLYRRHETRTWRYIERNVGNRATADELMQEVWFAVARQATRYQPSARFTTWLFTIAHNRIIDWVRKSHPHTSIESLAREGGSVAMQLTADPSSGPLATAVAHEQLSALAQALAELPAEQRDAFLMQIEGDLSVEDIAAVTGVSFETSKSRLRYARMKLRDLLGEHA
jgi:RNA polymerase sigma factor (sigma-70 family)